jgi:hypothetical protein
MAVMERNTNASRTDANPAKNPSHTRLEAVLEAPLKGSMPAETGNTSWALALGRMAVQFCQSVLSSGDLRRRTGPGLLSEERYEFESPSARVWQSEQSKYR